MLEKLSKQQEKLMYKHRVEFIDFIVNNKKHIPKDLQLTDQLKEDIDWVYKKADLKPPKIVLIARSYWEEKLMINVVFQMFKEGLLVGGPSQVGSQVWSQVWSQVGSQVWSQVGSQVESQVRSQVRSQVWSEKLEWIEQGFGLPWNSGWFSFYTYFEMIDIVSSPDFSKYFGLVKNHGLWSIQFFENWCIVTQLPSVIRRDDENRLHSTDGPSIEWRNGQKDHYIHGIYFESELWEKIVSGTAQPYDILKIENQEQRQAALSVIPLKTLLEKTYAVKIDSYLKPEPKLSKKYVKDYKKLDYSHPIELYSIDKTKILGRYSADMFGLDEEIKILHYFCPSTGREYFDFVPPNIEKANEAMAWKFNMNIKDYIENLVVET